MRDFKGRDEGDGESRREPGEPHPDWQRNRDYIETQLRSETIMNKIKNAGASTHWDGVQPEGTYQEPDPTNPRYLITKPLYSVLTSFWISWEYQNAKYSHPFSLHQDTNKLIEEWEKFFGLKGGPISKRGVYQPN